MQGIRPGSWRSSGRPCGHHSALAFAKAARSLQFIVKLETAEYGATQMLILQQKCYVMIKKTQQNWPDVI